MSGAGPAAARPRHLAAVLGDLLEPRLAQLRTGGAQTLILQPAYGPELHRPCPRRTKPQPRTQTRAPAQAGPSFPPT